jgi:hypothetical protein
VQNPEKKWGALGACHALNALNAGRREFDHSAGFWSLIAAPTLRFAGLISVVISKKKWFRTARVERAHAWNAR